MDGTILEEKPSTFTIDPADLLDHASSDELPGKVCKEPDCTNVIDKPARGRTPDYCPEHKPTSHKATGTTARSNNGGWAKYAECEKVLNDLFKYAGMGLMMVNQADGSAVAEGGPAVAHELVELGKTDRKIRKYLEQIAAPGKYGPLMFAVAGMVVPILANHHLIPTLSINLGEKKGAN